MRQNYVAGAIDRPCVELLDGFFFFYVARLRAGASAAFGATLRTLETFESHLGGVWTARRQAGQV